MFLNNKDVENVYRESVKRNKDRGCCVIGYNLKVNGEVVVPQPFQGNGGCFNVYEDVKEFLTNTLGIDEDTITVDYGRMD